MDLQSIRANHAERERAFTAVEWLQALQDAGLASFGASGFPSTRQEHWKYSSTKSLQRLSFETSGESSVTAADIAEYSLAPMVDSELVFVNGTYRADLSSGSSLDGIDALSFRDALAKHPTLMREHLGSLARFDSAPDWAFTALNMAFISDGLLVVVSGPQTSETLHIVHVQDASHGVTSTHPRALVVLRPNTAATVIQSFVSRGSDDAFTNSVTEIICEAGARLDHVVWGRECDRSYHVGRTEISVGRDANYVGTSVWTGGRWSRLDTDVRFTSSGGECSLNGLYIGGGRQHIDHHTCVDHAVPHCASRQLYKGVLGGTSKAVFNGRIHIHKDAQRSDSGMSNRNLLLSDKAVINTKPELEIYADDVKAAHGTTVGQLDEQSIHYMRTRGIPPKDAERILTSAFVADALGELGHESLVELLQAHIESRLDMVIKG